MGEESQRLYDGEIVMKRWLDAIDEEEKLGNLTDRDARELRYHIVNKTDFLAPSFREYWTDCWSNYENIRRKYNL